VPVYKSLGEELRKTLGNKLYRQVVAYLDERVRAEPKPVVHPTEQRVKVLPTRR
jgi:hypothetical protein